MNYYVRNTALGDITIVEEKGFITKLLFGRQKVCGSYNETELLKESFRQLEEYLNRTRTRFDLPLNPKGTSFQQKVWCNLYAIPYGETRTYKDIAIAIGKENSSRAVGSANNKNPIPIFIPCHRVIGSSGDLVGYAGGLKMKKLLLDIENNERIVI